MRSRGCRCSLIRPSPRSNRRAPARVARRARGSMPRYSSDRPAKPCTLVVGRRSAMHQGWGLGPGEEVDPHDQRPSQHAARQRVPERAGRLARRPCRSRVSRACPQSDTSTQISLRSDRANERRHTTATGRPKLQRSASTARRASNVSSTVKVQETRTRSSTWQSPTVRGGLNIPGRPSTRRPETAEKRDYSSTARSSRRQRPKDSNTRSRATAARPLPPSRFRPSGLATSRRVRRRHCLDRARRSRCAPRRSRRCVQLRREPER